MAINYFEHTEYLPHMTSYAQNFEDVTLRRALTDIERGFWVDIGAHHPSRHSVTRWFHEIGWTGVNVEPVPELFATFESERPQDLNVRCVIGGHSGSATLHVFGDSGLTTLSEPLVREHLEMQRGAPTERISVPMITLDELCEQYCQGRTIDFLKIDAEGAEIDIIEAATFTVFRPRIILIENNGWQTYESHLLTNNYLLVWYDGLNRWYVRHEDQERGRLIGRPPSLWDNFTQDRSDLQTLRDELAAMRSSTSWRATAPLRFAKTLIQRVLS